MNRSDTFWSIAECVIIDTLGIGLVTKGGDPVSTAAPTQPSLWAINRFGAGVAGELWWRVPTALAAAVSRAMDTYEASQMNTYHAFGSARWPLQYEELVKCLLPRETEVRLANLLPLLAQKFGERTDGVVTIDLRLTHQDLAAMVASTRESVTKVLNEMRNRDLIQIEAGRITLKDARALAELGQS